MRVAAAQIAPAFLNREASIAKVLDVLVQAATSRAELVVFPETFVAGYPWWVDITPASRFDDPSQKAAFAQYVDSAVDIGRGDGAGLLAHEFGGTKVSGLNCWENWMPLARAALYAQGPKVHVATWPGSPGISHDISRFVAMEGRLFVISAGAVLRAEHIPEDFALRDEMLEVGERFGSGGSIIVGPDGVVLAVAERHEETVLYADLDLSEVDRERQNFDPSGHYSRPDVLTLTVDRRRRNPAHFIDRDTG